MSVALVMQDRRQSKRLAWQMPVSITTLTRPARSCVSRDVSAHGMLLDSAVPFGVGEEVTVTFHAPRGMTTANGQVVRVSRVTATSEQLANITAVRFDQPVQALAAP